MKPLVSILIPAYNAEAWISHTLRSAIAQTWPHKEIIVVDDGSSDRTMSIVQQFVRQGVHVVTQKNQGAAAARNKAFALSQGDYIQWLDADDLLASDKVTKQLEALNQCSDKRTLLSSAWGRFLYRYTRADFAPTALWCDLTPEEWLLRSMEQNLYMQTSTWLVSREITDAAGPWDTRLLVDDDGEYFCRVLLQSSGIRFVPDSKVYYRASGTASLSYIGPSSKKVDAQLLAMQLRIRYLRSLRDDARARAACVKYIQTWAVYFYPERPDMTEKAGQMARELGGELEIPRLSWKYSWMNALVGRRLSKHAQMRLSGLRWFLQRGWDKAMFRIESRKLAGNLRI